MKFARLSYSLLTGHLLSWFSVELNLVSAGLVSLWRNNTYYFVKDELSRLGDGGAVKIFTDVSSGGKMSRKEHSVKVTHN